MGDLTEVTPQTATPSYTEEAASAEQVLDANQPVGVFGKTPDPDSPQQNAQTQTTSATDTPVAQQQQPTKQVPEKSAKQTENKDETEAEVKAEAEMKTKAEEKSTPPSDNITAKSGEAPVQEVNPEDLLTVKKDRLSQAIAQANVPEIVTDIIDYAISSRASDIHVEPTEQKVRIRYRIDGVLMEIMQYDKRFHPALVSRIKIISNLKIDEQRIPQDGRAQYVGETEDGGEFEADLRVSTLPTVHGEKIVMRIQDRSKSIPPIGKLGIRGIGFHHINEIIKAPNGIILVSGPTGSGKTTTLYSVLAMLNDEKVNIMTLEDPVEYQMEGLSQSQVRPDIGYNFASGLRTALRQDPDIIMIGEVRDLETIEIAIRAALTGHLVLSTIHTNSAIETITRIRDMGVQNFLLASSIQGIIAQRLVRKICEECKEAYKPSMEVFEDIKESIQTLPTAEELDPNLLNDIKIYRGKGCPHCNYTGYKGRVGLYEILLFDDTLKVKIMEDTSTLDLERFAIQNGMTTLKQDGVIKTLEGQTSIEEVYRVANKK
jgi:type IV pilus assembly protein PilB